MARQLPTVLALALGAALAACGSGSEAADAGAADGGDEPGADAAAGPDAGPSGAPIGGSCAKNSDCQSGECFATFPGGYCTLSNCTSCPGGALCRDRNAQQVCLSACASRGDCRTGYQCFEGACLPPCTGSDNCGAGARCEASTCVRDPVVACKADADCTSRLCLQPEGVCTTACSSRADCASGASCPWRPTLDAEGNRTGLRSVCAPAAAAGGELGAACAADAACRTGFCHLGACSEACKTGCPSGLVCVNSQEALKGAFTRSLKACLPAKGGFVYDLASRPATDPALAPAPDHAVSMTLLLEAADAATVSLPIPTTLTAPDGARWFDLGAADFDWVYQTQPIRFAPGAYVGTMLVSNTPAFPLLLGKGPYKFTPRLCDEAGFQCNGVPATRVFYKLAPGGKVDNGTLAFNFWFVGTTNHHCGSISAATAPGSAKIRSVVDTVRSIYSQAGITLGAINYYDVNQSSLYNVSTSNDAQVAQLFASSAGKTNRAVNVFFVRTITEATVLGQAGGIPGPPAHGTRRSGVVVTWETACYAELPQVVAHETGHYLGLFHNVEANDDQTGDDLTRQDPVADTTTTHANLMYWLAEGGNQLTAGQSWVLRNHFLVE